MASVIQWLLSKPKYCARVLMVGLDGAGKSSILYKLKLGTVVSTTPTVGFNLESISFKSFQLDVWDIGGQEKFRSLWKHYTDESCGLIYVVDSSDPTRLGEAATELHKTLPLMKNVPLLILLNKKDLKNTLSSVELMQAFKLLQITDRKWFVQDVSAITGDGLYEGIEWLTSVFDISLKSDHSTCSIL